MNRKFPAWCSIISAGMGLLTVYAPIAASGGAVLTPTNSSPEFVVTSWRMEQGLPSDRVRSVIQTRDSYLWIATFNGAARFDGVRFQVFNDANTPVLRNSLVSCLFEDAEGRLWLGSDTGEITWRDDAGFHELGLPADWPSFPIDRFVQSTNGTLWALSRDGFLLAVRNLKVELTLGRRRGPLYSDIVRDATGQVWGVRYGGRVVRFADNGEVEGETVPEMERNVYRTISAARSGGLWVRDGSRLRRWQAGEWVEDRGHHLWATNQSVVLYEGASGEVWVGTRDEGAFMVAADGSARHLTRASSLSSDLVSSISEDREGNIWLGSDAGGLQMLRPRMVFMVNPPDQWQHKPVSSVAPSGDGGLWIGTEGAGVYKLRGAEFIRMSATNNPAAKEIRTAVEDSDGRLWVGTQVRERLMSGLLVQGPGGGLQVGTRVSGLLVGEDTRLRPLTRDDTQIELPLLYYAIFQSRDGALWLGSEDGLVCVRNNQWLRLGTDLYRPEVRCITQTPNGAIWIGMRGGGVARYHNGKLSQFRQAHGLPSDYIWAILGDDDGSVWIGTAGAGLVLLREGRFFSFTTRQGLPSNFICSIQSQKNGQLWLGSHAGILKIARTELDRCARGEIESINCFVLDGSDGLASLDMAGGNQPAACATADGRLWFATGGGLAMVDPGRLSTNTLPPPVLFEEVVVDGDVLTNSPARPSFWGRGTRQPGSAPEFELRVPPGSGQIELRYTALSFCAPQRVRFRYLLEGVDDRWVEAGGRRSAYYAHLAPGSYRFRVTACNNDGVWNPEEQTAVLVVLPRFWQTWWFAPSSWLGGLCLVGAGVLTILRRRHRARIEALERARLFERERGRIARDLHDDLGSGLTDIGTTSALGQDTSVPSDEARGYLREINQRSNEMVMALDEIVWAVNPKNDDLNSLVTYFSQFTEHFVRLTGVRCRFEIPEVLPPLPLNAEQRHSLFLAFKEALQNAVKHSTAANLRFGVSVEGGSLKIVLEDDGHGFDSSALEKPDADGLRNMSDRLKQLGGRCEIITAPGKGTRVIFEVPARME